MGEVTINASSTGVTTSGNTANVFTDVYKLKVPAGLNYTLRNNTAVRMKLHTAGDAELPNNAEVLIGLRQPGQKQLTELCKLSYRPFANISTANQYNADTAARRLMKIPTKSGKIRVTEDKEIVVQVNSSTVADWDFSFLEIDVIEHVL